jgi:tetratricopeptide (TPR) repeat protein
MAGDEQVYQKAMSGGHSAAWDQNWDLAARKYRLAAEAKPQSHQAINSLGLALFELKRFEEARLCYVQAARLLPDNPLPLERLAEIYERTGELNQAAQQSMVAADLQLKRRDVRKAIENWNRVTRLVPDNIKAHSRLALVYERLGKKNLAILEYISVASLLQHSGRIGEALQTFEKGLIIDPTNPYIKEALDTLKANKTLPKPERKPGGTGSLSMAAIVGREIPDEIDDLTKYGPNPIAEARQLAITAQAEFLFDITEGDLQSKKGIPGLMNMFGRNDEIDTRKISLYLGSAIDFQTKAADKEAADQLKKAIDEGVNIPAVYFNLGYLYLNLGKEDQGLKNIQNAINTPEYALASYLLIGEYWVDRGNLKEAVAQYARALREADVAVIDSKWKNELRDTYEIVIEELSQEEDQKILSQLGSNIVGLIMQNDWRSYVMAAREQLPSPTSGTSPIPLSEILFEAANTEILNVMASINQKDREGYPRSAMEEALTLLDNAPYYLPLHNQMAELSMSQNNRDVAIEKYKVIAKTYAVRGEVNRANEMYRKVVNFSPMDFTARNNFIDYLLEQSKYEEAIIEYIDLADANYQLAQLNNARATYEKGLELAQHQNLDVSWSIKIYKLIADIDTQRLDWRQALRVYEQLRSIASDDEEVRINIFSLNMRLGNLTQAQSELDNYLDHLSNTDQFDKSVHFLEELLLENEELSLPRARLAELYQKANRNSDAISQWNKIVEKSMADNNKEGAKQALRAILVLNPPDIEYYRNALQNLN